MADAPPPPPPPMAIDGSNIDSVLSSSSHLTHRELLARRSRRLNQLSKIYRAHYWALMDEIKSKYKEYYWRYGRSAFKQDDKRKQNHAEEDSSANGNAELNAKLGLKNEGQLEGDCGIRKCMASGCKTKAMVLTQFCHQHILLDPNQKLYKSCNFVVKSTQGRPILCGKPVLRSTVPVLCPTHFERAESYVVRDLRKAGLSVSYPNKVAPKLHVVVSEFVRQIQRKRRAAKKNISKNQIKEVKSS